MCRRPIGTKISILEVPNQNWSLTQKTEAEEIVLWIDLKQISVQIRNLRSSTHESTFWQNRALARLLQNHAFVVALKQIMHRNEP